jgi:hypothetical protein
MQIDINRFIGISFQCSGARPCRADNSIYRNAGLLTAKL